MPPAAQRTHRAHAVNVTLHDVTVEAAVRPHRPLEVHARARPQALRKRGAGERLPRQLAGESLAIDVHRREAAPVDVDRAAALEAFHDPSGDHSRDEQPAAPLRGENTARLLDNAREHWM